MKDRAVAGSQLAEVGRGMGKMESREGEGGDWESVTKRRVIGSQPKAGLKAHMDTKEGVLREHPQWDLREREEGGSQQQNQIKRGG